MRQTGKLDSENDARRLAAYLTTMGIRSRVDESAGQWVLWAYEENDLARSREVFEEFIRNPNDSRYEGAESKAREIEREIAERNKRASENVVEMRRIWDRSLSRRAPVTVALILASAAVFVITDYGKGPLITRFTIAPYEVSATSLSYEPGLRAVREGQVWRLATPIVLHFGGLHLIFNMYMLYGLGGLVESRKGSLFFAAFVIVVAVASNLAQYQFSGPSFGGMSGVNYALFGYVWMKSVFDPRDGMILHPNTVFLMVAFFILCWTPAMGNVANAAHAVGLGLGMLVGYFPRLLGR